MATIAFIGGSGLAEGLEGTLEESVRLLPTANEFGIGGAVTIGCAGEHTVLIMPRHGEGAGFRSPATLVRERGYEANLWRLKTLGAEAIFGFSAVGALDTDIPYVTEGSFVVPYDCIRGFAASQHSFGNRATVVHPNMSEPFSSRLRIMAEHAILSEGLHYRTGIYIYDGGDALETPAEIKTLDAMTARFKGQNRVVGMTTVPEAILAKQLDIPFAAICLNVNYAEGLDPGELVAHETTLDRAGRAKPSVLAITEHLIRDYR